jgi:thioredoxin-dependent peroxiredoxin
MVFSEVFDMKNPRTVTMHGKPLTLVGTELSLGTVAPDFTVLDQEANEVRLSQFKNKVKVISVTPSLDTTVCDLQLRRFNNEASRLPSDVVVMNISMDLPFAIERFCAVAGIDRAKALSDHRDASFGNAFGVLIKELRLLARSVFILDRDNKVRYIEIVPELSNHPDYDEALKALRTLTETARAA